MKQIPATSVINEFGYLVSVNDVNECVFPHLWKFYCFHCRCPVEFVFAQGDQPAHFIHDLDQWTETALAICPHVAASR